MLERLPHSDGLGAIYPPMMYSIMALDVLGFAPDDPVRVEALRQFDRLCVDDGERFFFQPCFSPVWDTGDRRVRAGAEPSADASRACGARPIGCSAKEIRRKGDWSVKRPTVEPSGWAFEYRNEYYPDIDDTAMVMLALAEAAGSDAAAQKACTQRGARLAARDAIEGRRLGGVRRRQQLEFPEHRSVRRPQRDARSDLRRHYRPRAGGAGGARARPRSRSREARRRVAGAQSAAGRKLVRPLGRRLHLRHVLRAARTGGVGRERSRGARSARRRMAALHSERRRRLGRKLRQLRQSRVHRGAEHAFADRMGDPGPDRGRRRQQPERAARHRVPARDAARRRKLGRGTGHRHGLPEGLLPELPPVQGLLPAARAVGVREGARDAGECDQAGTQPA